MPNQKIYSVTRSTSSGTDDYIEYYSVAQNTSCDNARTVMEYASTLFIPDAGQPIATNIVNWSTQVEYFGSCEFEPVDCKVARIKLNDGTKLFLICGDYDRTKQWAIAQGVTMVASTMLEGVFRSIISCKG